MTAPDTIIAAPQANRESLRDILSRGHLRLVLLAVILAAVSLTVSGGVLLRGYANSNVELTARNVSYAVEPAMLFGDRDAVAEIVASLGDGEHIRAIEVTDSQDQLVGRWAREGEGFFYDVEALFGDVMTGRPQTVDVEFDGETIGTVTVYGSSRAMLRYGLSAFIIALACLALTVLATRILARRLEQEVLSPIEHVSELAHEVRTQRAFDRRVETYGVTEIDQLGADFNALLSQLQSWHETLTTENVELTHRVEHDPLTGLGNRERFRRMLETAIEDAERDNESVAVLYIDIDNFKEINDSYGHDVGDAAICAVADHLQRSTSKKGTVFRLGGDEFAMLLTGAPTPDVIERVITRIRGNLSTPFNVALSQEHELSVSIGVASYPDDGESARKLLRAADRRMYDVKRGRKNSGSDTQ